jgi:hypothetical protein
VALSSKSSGGRDERGVHHRGHRSLAVSPGDVQRREGAFGMTEPLAQPADVLEPELDAERLQCEQAFEHVNNLTQGRRVPPVDPARKLLKAAASMPNAEVGMQTQRVFFRIPHSAFCILNGRLPCTRSATR